VWRQLPHNMALQLVSFISSCADQRHTAQAEESIASKHKNKPP
jgi:hypothetical protein